MSVIASSWRCSSHSPLSNATKQLWSDVSAIGPEGHGHRNQHSAEVAALRLDAGRQIT
jgi:hypothetical protein